MDDNSDDRDELVGRAMDAGRALGAAAVFFHARAAEVLGLGPSDVKVLDAVREHGEVTPKELGKLVALAPASITGVLDRLEERGLVERASHPTDGRRLLIRLADDALERLAPLYEELGSGIAEILRAHSPDDLQTITAAFQSIADLQFRLARDLA